MDNYDRRQTRSISKFGDVQPGMHSIKDQGNDLSDLDKIIGQNIVLLSPSEALYRLDSTRTLFADVRLVGWARGEKRFFAESFLLFFSPMAEQVE